MSEGKLEPKILRPHTQARYLKLIALFKIAKGVLLLTLGVSLLFLNARTRWLDAISDWAADEILLEHGRATVWLLNRLQAVIEGGQLSATGFLALFYSAILFTEGLGVYFQKRWAELLMVFATAAFIPLEIRHVVHRPTIAAASILAANCFIVWFLYLVLKRAPVPPRPAEREVAVETR